VDTAHLNLVGPRSAGGLGGLSPPFTMPIHLPWSQHDE
jgi:hypothetical protein